MLALRPSGTRCDIAPTWLISDASNYSQQEFKRRQRASDGSGVGKGRGKGAKGDTKGKDDKGKGGRGKGGPDKKAQKKEE